jgi:hypothetical protein
MNRDELLQILQEETDGFTEQSRLRDDVLDALEKVQEKAINYTPCCESVKDKQTHTFEVNPEKWNSAYDRCNEITKILKAPSKIFLYDGDNYIELKP